jgi:hypothetical protein
MMLAAHCDGRAAQRVPAAGEGMLDVRLERRFTT